MSRPDFSPPDFIENYEAEEIQERMMGNAPADLSTMQGDFLYDFTMPTAIEIAELVQFSVMRTVMIAFPEFAWDEWLDLHGAQAGVTRKEAVSATGYVKVTGEEGTVLDSETVFCVPATDDSEDIGFLIDEETTIGESGIVVVGITAVEAGANGNVAADTIVIMESPIEGIESITNEAATSGGIDEEDDEDYYERIHAAFASSLYYIGNDTDFKRWALEINGIGDCIVVPVWNGPGTVKLVLVDSNGQPASDELVDAVYDHIVSPEDRSQRLLPTACADLTCVPATSRVVDYVCTDMVLDGTKTLEEIQAAFEEAVLAVYSSAKTIGVLRYNSVRPLISSLEGVSDFDDFQMDGDYENIVVTEEEYPVTGTLNFTTA